MNFKNLSATADAADVTKEQLIQDFKVVVADAEALLKASVGQGGEAMAAARTKIEESLGVARAKLADAQAALVDKTRAAAKATDVYVHENPWKAIGISAGVGLVVGLLIARR